MSLNLERLNSKNKKMNTLTALDKYTKAVRQVKDHQESNSAVFAEHKNLMMTLIDAENELRDAVAEAGAGVSDAFTKVVITPQTQIWADIEAIDKLIAQGKIPSALRDQIVKTQQRPPRITISEVKKDNI